MATENPKTENKELAVEFESLIDSGAVLAEKSAKELLNKIFQQH